MITHFAELRLFTVSIQGVMQVYSDRLDLPIVCVTDDTISFRLTPYTNLVFEEKAEPLSPVHFAITVPYTKFHKSAEFVKNSGLQILKWDDGHEIDDDGTRLNLYFRDGDGNLLEIIAHKYIKEDVLFSDGPFHAMYLREVGFPVENAPLFREWLKRILCMKTTVEGEIFNFVIGGTAHAVVTWKGRPWIPIAMKALVPNIHVTLGTPDISFMREVANKLNCTDQLESREIFFEQEGYSFSLRFTPEFQARIPSLLNLPLSKSMV